MKRLLPSVLFVFAACTLFAEERGGVVTDGNSLVEGIRVLRKAESGAKLTGNEDMMMAATVGYLQRFLGCSVAWSAVDKASPIKLPEKGIPIIQLCSVVDKYLSQNPGKLHESAYLLVFVAMMESFPNPLYKKQP
jgi:hypothetical protein